MHSSSDYYYSDDEFDDTSSKPKSILEKLSSFRINDEILNRPIKLAHLNENMYKNKQQSSDLPELETLGSVIYCVSSRSQIVHSKEMNEDTPFFLAWANMQSTTDTEFPVLVQNFFKSGYKNFTVEPNFCGLLNPTRKSIQYLSSFRHDYPSGRAVFHYVGQGFPPLGEKGIYTFKNSSSFLANHGSLLISYENLFYHISAPSVFIFDCDNAGIVIDKFKSAEDRLIDQNQQNSNSLNATQLSSPFSLPPKYLFERDELSDWFCLCATSHGEKLPSEPLLPKDFLSVALLTPVPLAILCHILRNYKTTFNETPLDNLNNYLKAEDPQNLKYLTDVLNNVVESVAADYLTPRLFLIFFRRESFIATIYRNFILAQYLLIQFSVHPISHPYLPPMWSHSSWSQLESFLDMWVLRKTSPSPFTSSFYFNSLSYTFTSLVSKNKVDIIKKSLLSSVSSIPFSKDNLDEFRLPFRSLAKYAFTSQNNRSNLTSLINFDSYMDLFFSFPEIVEKCNSINKPISTLISGFHALCYIILSCLATDQACLISVPKSIDKADSIINLLFTNTLQPLTKTLIAAIITILQRPIRKMKNSLLSFSLFTKIQNVLYNSEPYLMLWYILLLKRTYSFQCVSKQVYDSTNIEYQLLNLLFHSSEEIRAASISALSLFCIDKEHAKHIVFSVMICIFDTSFYVRNQILLLVIRSLVSHVHIYENEYLDYLNMKSINEESNDLLKQILKMKGEYQLFKDNLKTFIDRTQEIASDYSETTFTQLLFFVVNYFTSDPNKTVKENALHAKDVFLQKKDPSMISLTLNLQEGTTDEFTLASLDKTNNERDFPSDSDALFNACLEQLIQSNCYEI